MHMQMWRLKRQLVGIIFFIAVGALVFSVTTYLILTFGTCSDGIENQNEEGVDCGGSCSRECLGETPKPPVQLWTRFFEISQGRYDVASLVQNTNQLLGGEVSYVLNLYDKNAVVIASQSGSVMLYPNETLLILVSDVSVDRKEPKALEFQLNVPEWEHISQVALPVNVIKQQFLLEPAPRVEAVIENASIFPTDHFAVSVLLQDEFGNVFGVSKTVVDGLEGSEQKSLVFTWPEGSLLYPPERINFLVTRLP